MSELQTKLEEIKRQKDTYIIPENLKKDITVYGITGTLEPGSGGGDVKLFETIEEMQQDSMISEGDIAMVYNSEIRNPLKRDVFNKIVLEDFTINTLEENKSYSSSIISLSNPSDHSMSELSIDNEYADFRIYTDNLSINAYFQAQDNNDGTTTYECIEGGGIYDLKENFTIKESSSYYNLGYNDVLLKMFKIYTGNLQGLYKASYVTDENYYIFPSLDDFSAGEFPHMDVTLTHGMKISVTDARKIFNAIATHFNADDINRIGRYKYVKINNRNYVMYHSSSSGPDLLFKEGELFIGYGSYTTTGTLYLLEMNLSDLDNITFAGTTISYNVADYIFTDSYNRKYSRFPFENIQIAPLAPIVSSVSDSWLRVNRPLNLDIDPSIEDDITHMNSFMPLFAEKLEYTTLPSQFNIYDGNQILPGYTALGVGAITGNLNVYDNLDNDDVNTIMFGLIKWNPNLYNYLNKDVYGKPNTFYTSTFSEKNKLTYIKRNLDGDILFGKYNPLKQTTYPEWYNSNDYDINHLTPEIFIAISKELINNKYVVNIGDLNSINITKNDDYKWTVIFFDMDNNNLYYRIDDDSSNEHYVNCLNLQSGIITEIHHFTFTGGLDPSNKKLLYIVYRVIAGNYLYLHYVHGTGPTTSDIITCEDYIYDFTNNTKYTIPTYTDTNKKCYANEVNNYLLTFHTENNVVIISNIHSYGKNDKTKGYMYNKISHNITEILSETTKTTSPSGSYVEGYVAGIENGNDIIISNQHQTYTINKSTKTWTSVSSSWDNKALCYCDGLYYIAPFHSYDSNTLMFGEAEISGSTFNFKKSYNNPHVICNEKNGGDYYWQPQHVFECLYKTVKTPTGYRQYKPYLTYDVDVFSISDIEDCDIIYTDGVGSNQFNYPFPAVLKDNIFLN